MKKKDLAIPNKGGRPLVGTSPEIISELKELATKKNGLLRAEDVVEAARPESSPLHDKFEWDDDAAAEKYRLIQARAMLSVSVQYLPNPKGHVIPAKVFVSLSTDRHINGRQSLGYRMLETVVSNTELRQQLLFDALAQMNHFQEKYKTLQELEDVLKAMKKTSTTVAKKVHRNAKNLT